MVFDPSRAHEGSSQSHADICWAPAGSSFFQGDSSQTRGQKNLLLLYIFGDLTLQEKTWLHPFCKRFYWSAAKKRSAPGDDI